ncbi:MAG: DUF3887 domain-containing protein [Chloroflexota bacterium]|nr:DUF3887 domain-containing protein [Chloroflexota bacterium]
MRRLLLTGLLSLSALFGMGLMRAGTPTSGEIAGEFVIYLLADNYDAAYALFDPALQQTIPQTRLLELWSNARFYGGASASLRAMKINGDTAVVTVEFERLAYDVEVSVNPNGQIFRLFFTQIALSPDAALDITEAAPEATPTMTMQPPTAQAPTGAQRQATATVIVPTALPPTLTLPADPFGALGVGLTRALGADDYAGAADYFHPQLAAALPVDALEAAWTSITVARGGYVDIASYRVDVGSRTVVVRAELEDGVVEVFITVDGEGRVTSLYFV